MASADVPVRSWSSAGELAGRISAAGYMTGLPRKFAIAAHADANGVAAIMMITAMTEKSIPPSPSELAAVGAGGEAGACDAASGS